MKAVSPVRRHPSRKALNGGCCCGDGGGGGGGEGPVRCLAAASAAEPPRGCCPCCLKGSPPSSAPEEQQQQQHQALCLQCDMNDCYSRLRKLVPTIPPNKRVSKVEILQHVIDYILDLQLALETHPALLRQQQPPLPPPPPPPPSSVLLPASQGPPRTPLSALNADPAGAVNKQGDSILCR